MPTVDVGPTLLRRISVLGCDTPSLRSAGSVEGPFPPSHAASLPGRDWFGRSR